LCQTVLDDGPFDEWQLIEVGKIGRIHDGMTNPTMDIAYASTACGPHPADGGRPKITRLGTIVTC